MVTIEGEDNYLGEHGTEASHGAYERLLIEWKQQGTTPKTTPSIAADAAVPATASKTPRSGTPRLRSDGTLGTGCNDCCRVDVLGKAVVRACQLAGVDDPWLYALATATAAAGESSPEEIAKHLRKIVSHFKAEARMPCCRRPPAAPWRRRCWPSLGRLRHRLETKKWGEEPHRLRS